MKTNLKTKQNDNFKIINMFKDKPGDGKEQGDEAANLARFGPLDESSEEPAEIVTNIEEEEAGNGDIEGGGPGGVLGEGGLDLQGDGGEAAEGDQEADEDCCSIRRDLEEDTTRVDLDRDTGTRVTIGQQFGIFWLLL